MSEKYKTHDEGLYFVSFSVVGWIDVFVREEYNQIIPSLGPSIKKVRWRRLGSKAMCVSYACAM